MSAAATASPLPLPNEKPLRRHRPMKTTIRTATARTLATLGDAIRDLPLGHETTPVNQLGEALVGLGYAIDESAAASA